MMMMLVQMVMILLMHNLGFGPVRVTASSINVSSIVTPSVFDEFFSMHSSPDCPSKGFYTLSSFLEAASAFPDFATSSSLSDSKRELAAFCGFASGVTTGGCYVNATNTSFVGCLDSPLWECAPGKKYFGRGPLQVTWNTNYGPAGKAIGFDGINNPDLVGTDAVISFKVSLWFWMTVQPSESFSCHEAILTPDLGYVEVVKIMTGGSTDANFTQESFNIYASFCSILGVQPNVSTITPSPFSSPITSGCIGSLCSTRLKVLGLVLPLFLGAVILAVLICTGFYQCKRADRFKKQSKQSYERLHTLTEAPVSFHYTTLAVATKGFTTMVGKGAFGRVYKGLLSKGQSIAVKVLEDTAYSEEQFVGEIQTVGKLNHVNLVRLLGFCIDKTRRILVYEFIPNKSLDYYLFQKWNEEEQAKLTWKQRYDIALGVARGLTYIHEECRHKVIHRDLKPQNILLDEEFFPKIADFGLAKPMVKGQSVVMTWLKGTPGYVAPGFWVDGWAPLSSKSDVYSYGMVVFELVAGRKNVNESLPPSQVYLPELAFNNMLTLDSILEPSIVHEANLEEVHTLILVALWCIQEDPAQRPSMSRVVQYLEGVVDVPNDPPRPFRRLVLSSESNYKESSDGFSKLSVASYASNVLSTR